MTARTAVRHTPGPWRVAPASEYADTAINIDAGTRGYIATTGHRGDSEAEANARLIAAAPLLLAALREAASAHGRTVGQAWDDVPLEPWEVAAIAAIAAAEGRQ